MPEEFGRAGTEGIQKYHYIYFAKRYEYVIIILLPTQIYMEGFSTKEIKVSDTFSAARVHYQSGVSNVRDLITCA